MRVLCVVNDWPWPARSGFNIRLNHILRALGDLGTVDVVVRASEPVGEPDSSAPSFAGIGRVEHASRVLCPQWRRRLRWYNGSLPRPLLREVWGAPQLTDGSWTRREYDLVWFGHLDPYLAVGDAFAHTTRVVDIDNLEDWSLRHRLAMAPWQPEGKRWSAIDRLRSERRDLMDRIDARRFAELHRRVAAQVEAVTICSDVDRVRLPVENCFVVPNAYELDPGEAACARSSSRRSVGPVVVMVGLFRYAPNADGASCLVDGVLPKLRARWPDAEIHLVGRTDGRLAHLANRPGVVIREEVADIGTELRAADIAAVPIRFGGGTRIKVLEAFARRVPVVATTVGVEGLDVQPGQHLLVADEPRTFADACARLVEDPTLRKRTTEAAHDRWATRYRSDNVREAVTVVVDAALRRGRSLR